MATKRNGNVISGRTSAAIAASVERAVREGRLQPGGALPTVRALASTLSVSTSTVADAYRSLRQRGLIRTDGRRVTRIANLPSISIDWDPLPATPGLRILANANPEPERSPAPVPARPR